MKARTQPAPRKERGLYDQTLDVLSNVMFPVVVFLVWAAFTIVGTSVDQNQAPEQYYQEYPAAMANAILRLHLTNVFHSWPYLALVLLLLLSMAVCTFRRVIPKRFPKDRALAIENLGLYASRESTLGFEQTCDAVDEFASARGFAVRPQEIDGTHWLFADKHKWARYGVLVAHVGFAVISIGVFLGWLAGYKGEMQLYTGQTATIEQAGLDVTLRRFIGRFEPVSTKNGVMYQAKLFQSDLRIADANGAQETNVIVNHPYVSSGHVYLYQASYGFGGNLAFQRNGTPVTLTKEPGRLAPGDSILLPGTSRAVEYATMLGPSDPSQTPSGVAVPAHDTYALWVIHDNIPTTDRPVLLQVGRTFDAGDGYTITALPPIAWSGLTVSLRSGRGVGRHRRAHPHARLRHVAHVHADQAVRARAQGRARAARRYRRHDDEGQRDV